MRILGCATVAPWLDSANEKTGIPKSENPKSDNLSNEKRGPLLIPAINPNAASGTTPMWGPGVGCGGKRFVVVKDYRLDFCN